jgi:hypothetical protein
MVVDVDDCAVQTDQIPRAHSVVDADPITDAERGQGGRGAHRVQELLTGVNRLGDGGQVIVELSICNRFEHRALMVGPALGSLPAAGALSHRPRMIARPPD